MFWVARHLAPTALGTRFYHLMLLCMIAFWEPRFNFLGLLSRSTYFRVFWTQARKVVNQRLRWVLFTL